MNFTHISPSHDLWEHLKKSEKSILMYGMGNGADKILSVCQLYGISVSDFFASDGFVRGHSFHGKRVLSYSEAKQKYGCENMIVLLSFASYLPDVIANIKRIASECELYAPDVPVCGDTLFTIDFAQSHKRELEDTYNLFADEESRRIYENVIYYKLTGKIDYLFLAESDKDHVYNTLLDAKNITTYADLGAYSGDTIRELCNYAPSLSTVWAFEPDRRSFRKLSEYCDSIEVPHIEKVNSAAWNCEATLSFADEGNRNSGLFAKGKSIDVTATSLDLILDKKGVDYIKYDVEGCELQALEGSKDTILSHKPKLLVSLYHKSEDVFELPLMIKRMRPDYNFYIRRFAYIPAWDLNLLCI